MNVLQSCLVSVKLTSSFQQILFLFEVLQRGFDVSFRQWSHTFMQITSIIDYVGYFFFLQLSIRNEQEASGSMGSGSSGKIIVSIQKSIIMFNKTPLIISI